MPISRQDRMAEKLAERPDPGEKGPRARMKKVLLAQAMDLMQQSTIPSISDVAAAAQVSRATAYRYFPSQAAMIQEAVLEALGPVLSWESDSPDAEERIEDLLTFAIPRVAQYEATHRGALWLAIDQWARSRPGGPGVEDRIARGSRRRLLVDALAPLQGQLSEQHLDRLTQGLSLIFGIEALVVLRDIWDLDDGSIQDVIVWTASAMVQKAIRESEGGPVAMPNKNKGRRTTKRAP
ncbi:MAG: TetR/AcrR family transcriptional regulator [Alphaproteobacteria bacterium]